MNTRFLLFIPILLFIGCGPAKESKLTLQENIVKQEQVIDSIRNLRIVAANEMNPLIDKYAEYCEKNPTDSLSAVYLYRAAESCIYLSQGSNAISFLKKIESDFPKSEIMGSVLFLIGFTYENYQKDVKQAKLYYEKFLKLYPEHPLAGDTRILIQNLGKTPEEIIKNLNP